MNEVLTAERILEAGEEVLRRFGPAKANVVDVARALGVSHGSVYRHFASKSALRDAIAARWLKRVSDPLAVIAASDLPPPQRLRAWFDALREAKRRKVLEDPELFAATRGMFTDMGGTVVTAHIEALAGQLAHIIADGVASGDFVSPEPRATAMAIFNAMSRFHNPAHAAEWTSPDIDAAFEGVWGLVMAAISPAKAY